jgi:hypothetical protein
MDTHLAHWQTAIVEAYRDHGHLASTLANSSVEAYKEIYW